MYNMVIAKFYIFSLRKGSRLNMACKVVDCSELTRLESI
jgi:hypothetical protein